MLQAELCKQNGKNPFLRCCISLLDFIIFTYDYRFIPAAVVVVVLAVLAVDADVVPVVDTGVLAVVCDFLAGAGGVGLLPMTHRQTYLFRNYANAECYLC